MTGPARCQRPPVGLRRRCLLGGLLLPLASRAADPAAGGVAAAGQGASPAAADTLETELLKTGLYLVRGGGGHTLIRLTAAGAVLVGGKDEHAYPALMAQIRRINRIADLPLRVLILPSHRQGDAGSHATFRSRGMALLAQRKAFERLGVQAVDVTAGGAGAPVAVSAPGASSSMPGVGASPPASRRAPGPAIAFARHHEFRFGGVAVGLHHFGPAYGDDDAVALFPDSKVLALGHLVTPLLSLPDYAAGGSLPGWSLALARVMELDFEIAVPSAGPLLGRAEVAAFRHRVDDLVTRVSALVREGTPKDRMADLLNIELAPGELSAPTLDRLYVDLAKAGA